MRMKTLCYILGLNVFLIACQTKQKPETSNKKEIPKDSVTTSSVPHQETDTISEIFEEEMMDAMEFMPPIETNSYFGIAVGDPIASHAKMLQAGSLKSGEGVFPVHYIRYEKDTLGYVFGNDTVESLHIWDRRGSTHEGVRVGSTFAEIKQWLKNPVVHGSEMESRVHVSLGQHLYRLDYYDANYEIDIAQIPDSVRVKEIIITQ